VLRAHQVIDVTVRGLCIRHASVNTNYYVDISHAKVEQNTEKFIITKSSASQLSKTTFVCLFSVVYYQVYGE